MKSSQAARVLPGGASRGPPSSPGWGTDSAVHGAGFSVARPARPLYHLRQAAQAVRLLLATSVCSFYCNISRDLFQSCKN